MSVSAVVLAAGEGKRFISRTPKVLAKINSKPLIIYSLNALSKHPLISSIIIVVNARNSEAISRLIRKNKIGKVSHIVNGGRRRQDSVGCALAVLGNRTDLVLIHDACRPFISRDIISKAVKAAEKYQAAIIGVPVKATIKSVKCQVSGVRENCFIEKTLDRERLWEIQTPQVFKKELILRAYKKFGHLDVTDDAMLVEKLGKRVVLVKGSYSNIKITTPEDLLIAQTIAKRNT
ncbi:MAG: 2-C-methyl-D-erythritol 4-phosphate cytidylyltransferase [Candidatus Omnitrophota bacterium]